MREDYSVGLRHQILKNPPKGIDGQGVFGIFLRILPKLMLT
jgi:hypothetical protein